MNYCVKQLVQFSLCISIVVSSIAQAPQNSTATNTSSDILLGINSRAALLKAPFVNWFQPNYDNYIVDSATCKFVAPLLKGKKIRIFLGTWCGDSKREVPRILKMLDCCNFPPEMLELIMVSNQDGMYKQSPGHEEAGYNIVRVPTVIIEETGKEKGRIVEYPVVSLEKDLLLILKNEKYIPNYSGAKVSAR
ncbi:MAG: thiol reductase thioredoxin [Chitinophagaceae bacterium]|nr:thiol reductase thioredoxin [Chitinophagaceae bacterium]